MRLQALAALALAMSLAFPAAAHRLAPSSLSLRDDGNGRVTVLWKTPRVVAPGAHVEPVLPAECTESGEVRVSLERSAWLTTHELSCGATGLIGRTVAVRGLERSGTDALVHAVLADGREVRAILTASRPELVIPAAESRLRVMRDYLRLGIEHLIGGADHVLFVLGLLLLMRTRRRLFAAITAFTVGHSATLAVAALGLVHLPQGPVELAIAASLIVLAAEALGPRPQQSLLVRHPGLAPATFGLLHGLGFAAALAELGLPGNAIPLALLSFNVGIELAQLALVLAAWPLVSAMRRLGPLPRPVAQLPATAIGTLGVFWCLQRTGAWLAL